MLISDKLKSFDFTYAEKEIVKYFLNQKEEIARQSTREISKRLYCSPSSIIRLCQKLGFTGFEEFKEMLVARKDEFTYEYRTDKVGYSFLRELAHI